MTVNPPFSSAALRSRDTVSQEESIPQRVSLPAAPLPEGKQKRAGFYLPVRWKFALALLAGLCWMGFAVYVADAWVHDLSVAIGPVPAYLVIYGIAVVPGFMNAFLVVSLMLDRRPGARRSDARYPGISILVAAYNEEASIVSTIESIARQMYEGPFQVVVINDGSSDSTAEKLASLSYPWLEVLNLERNVGKANALNAGLSLVSHHLTITVDGDSYLYKEALHNLVRRYMSDPENTRAVAGAVLVRNSRKNFVTAIQEWDYFHGIAAIKRLQSLYQGTLVAQGAFSIYDTALLRELNGWPHTVGEDIVLTWAILERGYRVGFAENACLFTNAPDTWLQFIRQRQRWSRGLIEAFKAHWRLLFKPRMTTLFIWWNLLFPYMDLVYTFAFIPGLVLALFGIYWLAGPMTLLVLPLAMLVNYLMYSIQSKMFTEQGLTVRRNVPGFIFYALFYSIVLQPACVVGYLQEIVSRTKNWGTK
ncbi:MAG: glycosyltransferase family 2 protein [Gammaproteobacteria bacterium]|jgi:poly-beta-1,6-N-acetyl-D-glucosamine synthase|nr:glycosyltransferase family 2 protein [Gammaproteobacteria bacterium]MBU0826373.1 glycosyltransferase family 2 protein [Gammaproteobacteria bacterium]MBU1350911.1 glycosyltransferase family 2 protein [Gammaproteobacteria bacterium]MBU1504687.1 glycosyltransferase family 2 protein [Gammaproteobacteria bacterium]MBU2122602.1 glycosyltransferase family 2 protein [Gammaproteobacteria bacterium]